MFQLISVMTAALAMTLASNGVVVAQDEVCSSPETAGDYLCREILVTLVPGAEINDVVDRVVPGAVVGDNIGEAIEAQGREVIDAAAHRQWQVILPVGGDAIDAQSALRADDDVEDLSLIRPAELTDDNGSNGGGEALPDTAVPSPAANRAHLIALGLAALSSSLVAGRLRVTRSGC